MTLKLNKYDIITTVLLFIFTLFALFYVYSINNNKEDKIANVYLYNKLVHTFDLTNNELQTFKVNATNGIVKIEAKNGKVRVVEETSKRNLCSIQGWSDSIVNPIVCLPNNLYIKIESTTEIKEDVDVFIK